LSYDDLSVIEPDALMEMGSMTEEQVDHIVAQAEVLAEQAEKAADEERRRKKEEEAAAAIAGASATPAAPAEPTAATPGEPALATAETELPAVSGETTTSNTESERTESVAPPA
jgi:N utilization substance protein A